MFQPSEVEGLVVSMVMVLLGAVDPIVIVLTLDKRIWQRFCLVFGVSANALPDRELGKGSEAKWPCTVTVGCHTRFRRWLALSK